MADDGDDLKGKIQEKVGWLTGDREAEAKGKLRRLDDGDEAADDDDGQAVDEAERDLRQTYGEHDPAVDGAEVADEKRPVD